MVGMLIVVSLGRWFLVEKMAVTGVVFEFFFFFKKNPINQR